MTTSKLDSTQLPLEYENLLLRRSYVGNARLLASNHEELIQKEVERREANV